MKRLSFWERFDAKIAYNELTGCHEWTSALAKNGYGVFWVGGGKSQYAHRLAYERANGQISEASHVCHKCDNKKCVNPHHLFEGTSKDNRDDCVAKKRHAFGEKNGSAKTPEYKIRELKFALESMSSPRAAELVGVSRHIAKMVKAGRIWKHISV